MRRRNGTSSCVLLSPSRSDGCAGAGRHFDCLELSSQRLEVLDALTNTVHRTLTRRRFAFGKGHILFQHVPSGVARSFERSHRSSDRCIARTSGWEQTVLDRAHPIELSGPESVRNLLVDVLHMNQADPVALLLSNGDWVCATDEQVAGVEAEKRR